MIFSGFRMFKIGDDVLVACDPHRPDVAGTVAQIDETSAIVETDYGILCVPLSCLEPA
jgi:hypothetical protein